MGQLSLTGGARALRHIRLTESALHQLIMLIPHAITAAVSSREAQERPSPERAGSDRGKISQQWVCLPPLNREMETSRVIVSYTAISAHSLRANRWPLCPRCPLEQLRSVFDNQPEIAPYPIMPLGLLVSIAVFLLLERSGDEAASRAELTGTPHPFRISPPSSCSRTAADCAAVTYQSARCGS
jgi:hypothetical protein